MPPPTFQPPPQSWWLGLPPDQFRAAVLLMLALRGTAGLDTSLGKLSTALSTSKTTLHRTVDQLIKIGFIHRTFTAVGRGGGVSLAETLPETFLKSLTDLFRYEKPDVTKSRGTFSETFLINLAPSDLDLSNSPKKSESDPSSEYSDPKETEILGPLKLETAPVNNPQPTKRIKPTLSDEAFRHADALATRIMAHDRSVPFAAKGVYSGNSPARVKFASVMQTLHATRGVPWEAIGGVIRALYPDGGAPRAPELERFVVLSADKFANRFSEIRENQLRARSARESQRGYQDNRPAIEPKKWST